MSLSVSDNHTLEGVASAGERAGESPLCFPEKSSVEMCLAIVVFALTFAYLCIFRRFTGMEPDEGIVLQGAERVLRGEVPYRDFFSFYTPGSYYLLAGLFRIFGDSLGVARTALALSGSVASLLTYLLARRVCTRSVSLLTAGLVTLTALPSRFLVLHNWDSTLWACLGLYCAVRWLESPRMTWAFAAGSFASLTFLFEQSKGGGLILGMGAGLLAITLSDRQRPRLRGTQLAGLAVGLAWPVAVTLAYFGMRHSLQPMLADWFWPLQHYSMANRVPYGYQNWSDSTRHLLFGTGTLATRLIVVLAVSPLFLVPVLPLVAIGLMVYWVIRMWRQRSAPARGAYYVLINATLAGLLLSIVIARADILHFMYLQPLFFLLLGWLIDGRDIPGRVFKAVRPFVIAYVLIAFLALSAPLLLRAVNAPNNVTTRRGVLTMPGEDTVIEYVQAHVAPGQPILVYPYLPLYYYLTGTLSSTRYDYVQPGMHTNQQLREMISQLVSHPVDVVLLEVSFDEKIPNSWPGTPLSAMASDPVSDYILKRYRTCKVLKSPADWRFLFMVRNDLACP
jgi:4-amino-4-deoxy-L-arabinose transferase-like glycosyltransferase